MLDEGAAAGSSAGLSVDFTAQNDAEDALIAREALFQGLLERTSEVAVVTSPDGTVLYADATVAQFGYVPEEVLGARGFEFVHPEDRGQVLNAFAQIQERPEHEVALVYRHRHADGMFRWVESCITNRLHDPEIGGIVVNLRDVTAKVEVSRAMRESETRYRAIAETAQEGIWITSPQGKTLYVNQKMADIAGRPSEDLYAVRAADLLDPEDAAKPLQGLQGGRDRRAGEYELLYPYPDGSPRWLRVARSSLLDEDGECMGSLCMVSDVTAVKEVEEAMRRHALHDQLTGLPNRNLLGDRLDQATERHRAGMSPGVTVVFVDLDQFKLVNDSLGHAAGDQLLIDLASRLQGAAHPGETVARFVGDGFVVVSEELVASDARNLADRVLAALAAPFEIAERSVPVTASAGIATSAACPPGELLQSAEAAMYLAKGRGRGQVEVFDPASAAEIRERFHLYVDLANALEQDQLEVHYQPIVELGSGHLLGLEALARWTHPQRGVVSPQSFVSLAEQGGLVCQLDRWVLGRATAELAELRSAGLVADDVYVSVNISATHMAHGDLESAVTDALWMSGVPAACLVLEVTETAMMADPDASAMLLGRIVDHGASVALDDFGTGYSSLAYLKKLPVASLKIDRCFVENIANGADDLAICASVVDLCRAVGVRAVAKGVETLEQLDLLQRLDCHAAQGHLWSPPLNKSQLRQTLSAPAGAIFDVRTCVDPDAPTGSSVHPRATWEHGLPMLLRLHQAGASLRTIAAALTKEGYRSPRGTRWHPTSVASVISEHDYPGLWRRSQ